MKIATVIAGQSPPSKSYNQRNEGLPFLQGSADFSYRSPVPKVWCDSPQKKSRKGDILFSVRAPVGEVNRSDRDYAIGRGLAAIRAKECDADFLYHALKLWRTSLQRVGQGTTFDAITARHFAALHVALPTKMAEQAVIARILDAVDTALERTRHMSERVRDLFESLVTELLCRGIGHDGKLRDPFENASDFVDTSLGRVPRDWRIGTVGNEFEVQSGFTINSNRRPRLQKRRYLRVANVQRDFLDLSEVHELEAKDHEFSPRSVSPDDLLIVEGHADSMEIGRCALVTEEAAGMTFQNHLYRLRTKGDITAIFACMWLNSTYAQRFWNARCATSSGLNTINQRALKQLILPVPSEAEQHDIVSIVEQTRRHRDSVSLMRSKLEGLKSSLMHDLLTGRVRVDDAAEARLS